MKKFIKILFVLGFYFGSLGVAFVGGIMVNNELRDPEIIKDYVFVNGKGASMYPTLPTGKSPTIVFTQMKPKIGDIISFECLPKGKCFEQYTPEETPFFIQHRLLSIAPDGCMEIRGDNVAVRDPNEPCYYPDKDIKILGVVKGLID